MNFYDVLAAEKWDGGIPTINFFDLLFAQSTGGEQWQVYDGTLPATFNANGDNMKQYQVWGNTGGVGDRTAQLFDKNATDTDNGYIVRAYLKSNGTVVSHDGTDVSEYIPVSGNTVYILRYGQESGFYNAPSVCFYDISKNFISGSSYSNNNPKSFTTPAAAAYVRLSFSRTDANIVVLAKGSTIPEPLPPFGYEVDMNVKSGNWFDYSDYVAGYYISSSGVETESSTDTWHETVRLNHSDYIGILPNESYTISAHHQLMYFQQTVAIAWYDENKIFITRDSTVIPIKNSGSYSFTSTAPQNAKFAIFNFFTDNVQKVMFTPGSTPLPYQPYFSTVIPVYIGDEPLDKDEYVDYVEQKVYRRTVNLFDISAQTLIDVTGTGAMRTGVYLGFLAVGQYTLTFDAPHNYSLFITRKNGNTYTFQDIKKSQLPFTFLVNSGDEIIIRLSNTQTFEQQRFTNICVTPGTTPPETYVPYYQPTDPPVPLPALPTCEGTTVIDYAGQSVAPEKVLLEYAKGGN